MQHSSNSASGPPLSYINVHYDKSPASGLSIESVYKGRQRLSQSYIQQSVPDLNKDFGSGQTLRLYSQQITKQPVVLVSCFEDWTQQLITQAFTKRFLVDYIYREYVESDLCSPSLESFREDQHLEIEPEPRH